MYSCQWGATHAITKTHTHTHTQQQQKTQELWFLYMLCDFTDYSVHLSTQGRDKFQRIQSIKS